MLVCTAREKRHVYSSDDPTEQDFQIFKEFTQLQPRFRRAAQISKKDATLHCAKRVSDTEIGRLCTKVGVDVQALVEACSVDVEVC